VCVCVAIDLTYGVVLCFACHDYVYCDEVDTIAQTQRQSTTTSLGSSLHSLGSLFHSLGSLLDYIL